MEKPEPRVLQIYDAGGLDASRAWVATQTFGGETLGEYLYRRGELPVGEAARILVELTDALLHAHQHGVVHLDIRPDNILLLWSDGERRVLVVDWGISGVASGAHYEAPEQLRGLACDGRADIHTLGLVAYEMLAGTEAYHGTSPFRTAIKQLYDLPPPITLGRPDVPVELDGLVRAMLAKDPAMRPWLDSVRRHLVALIDDDDAPEIEIESRLGVIPFARSAAGEIVSTRSQSRSR